MYDPSNDRLDRAIGMVWLLYKWGSWSKLVGLGLVRSQVEPHLEAADTELPKKLTSDLQRYALIRHSRAVLDAALRLQAMYQRQTVKSRLAYYEKEDRDVEH